MRLIAFSVTNFRSITNHHRIPLRDSTILIGKNNEGKSNVLRALNIAMRALKAHAGDDPITTRDPWRYQWRRDFPISLQGRTHGTESIFRLEFELDEGEVTEFRGQIKSALNGTLPIEIKFGKNSIAAIHVPKRGPGGTALSKKSSKIASYIAEHIEFNYIPAIRTEDEALSVVQEMLSDELSLLEEDKGYQECMEKIEALQQPILKRVSASIKTSLSQFLPNISGVEVVVPSSARRLALRSQCKVYVDDGSRTLLEYKGDGVKSLAALGLLKDKNKQVAASIIAIEEPESHLHPGAMHGLKEVISELAKDNQVVLTTHCPLFVDRGSISTNIIIDSNSARPARDIGTLRALLGVRASDNLVNASHVLVVEGDEDVLALTSLLSHLSPSIGKALKQHQLVIEPIHGAGNLSYKLSLISNALCVYHVFLDHDDAGRVAFDAAEKDGLLKLSDVTLATCRGAPNTELEDCFNKDVYEKKVLDEFGVNLNTAAFKGNAKWSDRAKACFEAQGKIWNSKIQAQLKAVVAEVVSENPDVALNIHKRSAIDALVSALEIKLNIRNADVAEAA